MQKLAMTRLNRYAGLNRNAGEIILALGACLAGFGVSPTCAQDYPSRPIRIIVPFSPGGAVDGPMRLIAQELSKRLGQPVFVENKPGAGATIGSEAVAKSPPDGYTLLLASQTNAISASLYSKLAFNPIDDFAPISLLGREPGVLVVHPSLPVKDGAGTDRLREGAARQDRLRLVRQRQRPAPVRRHVRLDGGHQHEPRPLSRQRPGHHRSDRRAGAGIDPGPCRHAGSHQGGQAARAGGDRHASLAATAGGADAGRVGAERLFGLCLDGPARAQGNAGARSSTDCIANWWRRWHRTR